MSEWVGTWKSGGDYDAGQIVLEAKTRAKARLLAVSIYGHGNVVVRKKSDVPKRRRRP